MSVRQRDALRRAQVLEGQLKKSESALGSFRALDLTDEQGLLCGKVLASLGAEVIKVEPPGGDQARNIPPFYKDIPHPEKSLYYLAYNANKKSITLNIDNPDGQGIFRKLVKTSDFIIESFEPGHMDQLGLGYSELSGINPRIIMTSITPFGQTGPYRNYKPSDLVCSAMSGFMYLTGDPDRAPLQISAPQAYLMGAVEGAVGTMTAHYYRERTGEGQHVDVSIRDAMIKATVNALPWWEHYGKIMKRGGNCWMLRGEKLRVLWPCKDGYVSFALHGGRLGAKRNRKLVEWMDSEGMASDYLKSFDWDNLDMGTASQKLRREMDESVLRFFMAHTKKELNEQALDKGIMLSPVCTMEDIAVSPQLEARDFWDEVEHPELGTTITYPGAFTKASETPCLKTVRAPYIGEHNEEIYVDMLGVPRDKLASLKEAKII
jgi:crotonobetainyl-CoA:carnitine CoA-transferase CaiB-like acyl-CoA transferase